ncbi:MAG: hypothetical protein V9G04_09195 [Nocardioides sp.]|jgi:ABC-2 type transport system permease protein
MGTHVIETPPAVWAKVDGLVLRGVVLVALAAILGFALTMLFRSTVATLGILFAVAVAGSMVIMALPLGGTNERWLPTVNLTAWLQHGADYYVQGREVMCTYDEATGDQACTGMKTLSLWNAATYLATIVVASVCASLASFARRDVP